MSVNLSIDPQKTRDELVDFIKNTLTKTGFQRLVIGLSGGVDSTTSLALGIKAVGAENIYVGIFPYGDLNTEGTNDAKLLLDNFHIPAQNVTTLDIKLLVDPIIQLDSTMNNLRKGNIMVRTRMILLYDMSKKYNALVLGTENKIERLLGYFTRFGDEASDVEPLYHLYKTQVRQLASYLKIPERIINKIPTAGMWPGQTDEGEFGFTYEEADQILYLYFDKKQTKNDIVKAGFSAEKVAQIIKRAEDNSFKHHLPYTPK